MRRLKFRGTAFTVFAAAAAIAVTALIVSLFPAKSQVTVGLPFATNVSVTTSSAQLIGANPSRRSIQICTPGNTNVVAIAPAPLVPVQPGGPGFIMTGTATQSTCFTPPSNYSSGGSGGSQGGAGAAWNAIASATTNVLVLEW